MTDLSKSSIQQVVDLVNTDNSSTLTTTDIGFGVPVPLVDDPSGKNTSVVVSAVPNSPYTGDVTVTYNRLDMAGFLVYGPAELNVIEDATINDVVTSFNAHYGANLSVADDLALDLVVPPISYQPTPMDLVANAASLAYIGEIEITVGLTTSPLNTIIVNVDLDGLSFPGTGPTLLLGTYEQVTAVGTTKHKACGAVVGDFYYQCGGYNGTLYQAELRRFDLINETWSTMASLPDIPLAGSAMATDGEFLYVVGGRDSAQLAYRTLYAYEIATDTWTSKTQFPLSGETTRESTSFVLDGDFIYMYGGSRSTALYNDHYRYSISGDSWTTRAAGPAARTEHSALLHEGKIYVFGGKTGSPNTRTAELWAYDIAGNSWSQLTSGPAARSAHSATIIDGIMYIFGGIGNGATTRFNQLWAYEIATDTWTEISTTDYNIAYAVGFTYNGEFYVDGGSPTSSTYTNILIKIS